MDALFTLVRQLAFRQPVTDLAVPKWLLQQHGLAPLAARAGLASCKTDLIQSTLSWARLRQEIPRVVQAFMGRGIAVSPLKGLAYAETLYDTPAERPMSDVDLMVARRDVPAAGDALRKLGFVRTVAPMLHHAEVWVRDDIVVDLHWSIIAQARGSIDMAALWSRMSPPGQNGLMYLEDHDALAFHLIHLARNRLWAPLINVVDHARLLQRGASPRIALDRARRWGLGRAVQLALRFCTSVLEAERGRLAGWLGPSRSDAAMMAEPPALRKLLFDAVAAGSPTHLAVKAIGYAGNRLRALRTRM